MKLRSNFDSDGNFHGFSVWLSGSCEWSCAADYKTVVLAYRRAQEEREVK
jgi:hypothetical protein